MKKPIIIKSPDGRQWRVIKETKNPKPRQIVIYNAKKDTYLVVTQIMTKKDIIKKKTWEKNLNKAINALDKAVKDGDKAVKLRDRLIEEGKKTGFYWKRVWKMDKKK